MDSTFYNNDFRDSLISVVIPCRNEKKFIQKTINSILTQKDINKNFEIIVVDGQSEDGTREILNELQLLDKRITILDNPQKITPVALNIGIKKAKGDFIFILGAHAKIDEDYISSCLKIFDEHPEVSCAGGPIISKGNSSLGKSIALAMSSPVGVGNAKHRFPDYEGYAEMACFPAFKKEVFKKIGYYDERLVRNQDDDFCFRLRLKGDKVYISPKVKSIYYVRDNLKSLFKQYYQYGFWRVELLAKHKLPIALRQQIPFLFFLCMILLIIISIAVNDPIIGITLPALYLTTLFIYSIIKFIKEKKLYVFWLPVVVFTLHISYALGFASSLIKKIFKEIRNKD